MDNKLMRNALERVKTYYTKGFKAALEMAEQAGNLEVVKANSDKILDEIFGVMDTLVEKESDENVDGC